MTVHDVAQGYVLAADADEYRRDAEGPSAAGYRLLDAYVGSAASAQRRRGSALATDEDATDEDVWRRVAREDRYAIAVVHAAMDRLARGRERPSRRDGADALQRRVLESLLCSLCARPLPFEIQDLQRIIAVSVASLDRTWQPWRGIVYALERYVGAHGLPAALRPLLLCLRAALTGHYLSAAYLPLTLRLDALLGRGEPGVPEPTEPWAGRLLADLAELDASSYDAWRALLAHIPATNGVAPSRPWRRRAAPLLAAIGRDAFARSVVDWFDLAAANVPAPISARNATMLVGLVWYCGLLNEPRVADAVARLADGLFRAVPGGGPRSARVAHACRLVLDAPSRPVPALRALSIDRPYEARTA